MSRDFEFTLPHGLGPEWATRIDEVFAGENLLQTILHAHLLLEQAMGDKIRSKLARPEILERRWTFDQKLYLYIGLCDPPEPQVLMLKGFNNLRNRIAHRFADVGMAVEETLPWNSVMPDWAIGSRSSDARIKVRTIAMILLFDLEMLVGVRAPMHKR